MNHQKQMKKEPQYEVNYQLTIGNCSTFYLSRCRFSGTLRGFFVLFILTFEACFACHDVRYFWFWEMVLGDLLWHL